MSDISGNPLIGAAAPSAPTSWFPGRVKPYNNIQPFTYRDGETYLDVQEALRRWLMDQLVPFIDSTFEEYVLAFNTEIAKLGVYAQQFQDYIEAQKAIFDGKIENYLAVVEKSTEDFIKLSSEAMDAVKADADRAQVARDQAERFASTVVAFQDAAVSELVNSDSTTATAIKNLMSTWVDVKHFGAKFDGTDDSAALIAAMSSGRPLWFGGSDRTYTVTRPLNIVLARAVRWTGEGATIKVDSTGQQARTLNVDTNGFDLIVDGLEIDGNRKTHMGFAVQTSSAIRSNVELVKVKVRNVYRASQELVGGDGIYIRGAYKNVYLDRPDVRDIVMAAGAGVTGSQGVAGITISSAGPSLAPVNISIAHPYVENVYCEDYAYMFDQDGIRIFTEEDNSSVALFDTNYTIIGGQIKNVHGRAFKSQAEFGRIIGMQIERRPGSSSPWIAGQAGMPEIDFQVGGGIVENVEIKYQGGSAPTIVQGSGTRLSGGKYSTSLQVRGLKVSASGGSSAVVGKLVSIDMREQRLMNVFLSDIEFVNLGSYLDSNMIGVTGYYLDAEVNISANNIAAPMNDGNYVVFRGGIATPINAHLSNICNSRKQSSARLQSSNNSADRNITNSGYLVRIVA